MVILNKLVVFCILHRLSQGKVGIGELASTREAREMDDGNERRARFP